MTVIRLLRLARDLSPSNFGDDTILMWISQVENILASDVAEVDPAVLPEITEATNATMLVPHPYDRVYLPFVQAQIAYAQGETDLYQNYLALYNAYRDEWIAWVRNGKWRKSEWYVSAYALAVEHGFTGTIEEWLESLHGEKGERGDGVIIIGHYDTLDQLQEAHPTGRAGDYYEVGTQPDNALVYYWAGNLGTWVGIDIVDGQRKAREAAMMADVNRSLAQQAASSAEKNAATASGAVREAMEIEDAVRQKAAEANTSAEAAEVAMLAAQEFKDAAGRWNQSAAEWSDAAEASAQRAEAAARAAESGMPEVLEQIAELRGNDAQLGREIQSINNRMQSISDDVSALGRDYAELQSRVESNEGKIRMAEDMISINGTDIGHLQSRAEQVDGEIGELNQRLRSLNMLAAQTAAEAQALQRESEEQKRILENIMVAADGNIYSQITDDQVASRKMVPAKALPNAVLESIGGRSIVLNQLAEMNGNRSYAGLTFERTGTAVTVSGTSTASTFVTSALTNVMINFVAGHKYMLSLRSRDNPEMYLRWGTTSATRSLCAANTDTALIAEAPTSVATTPVGITLTSGAEYNFTIDINVIDLTVMFGAGHEPMTVQDAYSMGVPRRHVLPTDGEIQHADVIAISVSGQEMKTIPLEIRDLPGYGMSAGDVYNEVDLIGQQYIQRVAESGAVLPEQNVVDISYMLPEGFEQLRVQGGGEIGFEQDGWQTIAVPSRIGYLIKLGGET